MLASGANCALRESILADLALSKVFFGVEIQSVKCRISTPFRTGLVDDVVQRLRLGHSSDSLVACPDLYATNVRIFTILVILEDSYLQEHTS